MRINYEPHDDDEFAVSEVKLFQNRFIAEYDLMCHQHLKTYNKPLIFSNQNDISRDVVQKFQND